MGFQAFVKITRTNEFLERVLQRESAQAEMFLTRAFLKRVLQRELNHRAAVLKEWS